MTVLLTRGCSAALIYTFAAQGAYADLTAQDVWSDWRSYLTSAGYEVTGTESTSGGTLTVSNASFSMPLPDTGGVVDFEITDLKFQENADGTVNVMMPGSMPIRFTGVGDDDEKISAVVDYTQSGNTLIVSGSPKDLTYNYSAAEAGLALASLSIDDEVMAPETARVSLTLANLSGSTQMKVSDMRAYSQRMNADSVSLEFAFDDPDSDDGAEIKGTLQGFGFQGGGQIPLEMNPDDFQAMLKGGFAVDGTFTYASGATNMKGQGDGDAFTAESSSQGGVLKVAVSADNITYDVNQKAADVTFTSADLPFPVAFNAAVSAFNMVLPVSKSDDEQDFAFGMTLGDFTMSDMLWGMFDPSAVLPRDPATIDLDLTGKAKVLFDFMDPNVVETLESSGQAPGELNALIINKLLVSMVGATLTGTGDFTFDNSDKTTYDGMPKPTGQVDLQLVGGNGLLDRLIQMGFVSDQDAMGARMMMGLLAVPGEGEDTLKSKLEINEEGHIMANGQRIQ